MEDVYTTIAHCRVGGSRGEWRRGFEPGREWQLLESHGGKFQLLTRIGFEQLRAQQWSLFASAVEYETAHRAAAVFWKLWRLPWRL